MSEQLLKKLLVNSQQGDKESYEKFMRQTVFIVEKRVNKKVFLKQDQADIVQECLLGIHKSLHTFSPEKKVLPWLNAIIHYKVVDYIKGKTKKESKEILSIDGDVTFHSIEDNDINEMVELINLLPKNLSEPLILTKIKGYSTSEAAKIINIKENALRTRVSRGTSKLKKIMEESL